MILASGLIEAAAQLADILQQVEVLDNDIQSLQRQITALFGLETAPASTSALRERLAEIRRLRWQCYSYAMRLQTLIKTALRTIQHVATLVNSISTFLGAKQGMQTLTQVAVSIEYHADDPGGANRGLSTRRECGQDGRTADDRKPLPHPEAHDGRLAEAEVARHE